MCKAFIIWLRLFMQFRFLAFALALLSAGNNIEARMAMIAMTTSSSIKVKARPEDRSHRGLNAVSRRIDVSHFIF